MQRRPLGATGLTCSVVGLGAGVIGEDRVDDEDAARVVAAALDLGVTLFDTARSYGASEDRLGRALRGRRDDVVLVTKGGYGVEGAADWSPEAVRRGIDDALRRLGTDRLDVFLLHSCPMETLVREELLVELDRAKEAGKIRARGYSGENEELAWAVASGRFDVVECSVSVVDRGSLEGPVREAAARGIAVLAKRPLGNAPWRFVSPPEREDMRVAWERFRALAVDPAPLGWNAAALRFSAFAPGVSCALVGTASVEHLHDAARAAAEGPLPAEVEARLSDAWKMHGSSWRGVV